jgi:hypothetical protein
LRRVFPICPKAHGVCGEVHRTPCGG